MTDDEHVISATAERRREGGGQGAITRYRARCSCGAKSYMHYGTAAAAKTAMRRTHLVMGVVMDTLLDLREKERRVSKRLVCTDDHEIIRDNTRFTFCPYCGQKLTTKPTSKGGQ
jgi:hypothetical protein